MKISQIREDGKVFTCRQWEIDKLMEQMKVEIQSQPISKVREILPRLSPGESYEIVQKVPKLLPAVRLTHLDGGLVMKAYTGLVMFEINRLADETEVNRIKEIVRQIPQTFACFKGLSGKSIKVWVRFCYPNNELPDEDEKAQLFHAHAYRLVVKYYQPQLPFEIELKEPTLTQYCRWTYDEERYYNPKALPIYLEQPLDMPGEVTYREQLDAEKSPIQRMLPGYDTYHAMGLLFEAAFNKALRGMEHWHNDDDRLPLIIRVADCCVQAGIPEEETVRRVLHHFYLTEDKSLVRQTVLNVYVQSKGFDTPSGLTIEQLFALQSEEFMSRRYEFRYNQLTTHVEYRQRSSFNFTFRPVDKHVCSSIVLNAMHEGIKMWDRDVVRYLDSDRVPVYNPIEAYLSGLPEWDRVDRLKALSERVQCTNPSWPLLFHRWLLCMVAHWRGMDKRHANSTSPLLIGPQSYRKSTFCRLILPPCLQDYYTDSIDFSRKRDAELYLNRFALINMDEFDQISSTQQTFLKHILQKPIVNTRRPNSTTVDELRRYASFIATSNHQDVLTDTTGSRRFIAIQLTAPIEIERPIHYDQIYAQVVALLNSGERYWFDTSEEALLKIHNEEFEQLPVVEQLFQVYFRSAHSDETGQWLLAAAIFQKIQQWSKVKIGNMQMAYFGRILKHLGVENKRINSGTLYHVVVLEQAG